MDRGELKSALTAGRDCLSPGQLEKLSEDPSIKSPHLVTCARCQAELSLLKAFQSDAPLEDEGAAVPWIAAQLEHRLDAIKGRKPAKKGVAAPNSWLQSLWQSGTSRILMAAAAVIVLSIAGLLVLRPAREPELRASNNDHSVIYRSQELTTAGPSGELLQVPKKLEWLSYPGAVSYQTVIMEVDKNPIWTGKSNYVSLTIPSEIRDRIIPGKPLLWQVSALDAQGHVLATSQIQRFSVARQSSGNP